MRINPGKCVLALLHSFSWVTISALKVYLHYLTLGFHFAVYQRYPTYLRWTERSGRHLVSSSNQFSIITFGYRPATSGHIGPVVAWICYSTDAPHLLVPTTLCRVVFDILHSLAHPGIAATVKLISARFFWPNMRRGITAWARSWESYKKSKVHKHICAPLGTFSTPDAWFSHVHIDLTGPWPVNRGFKYLLTCIDRFIRCPEASPLRDISGKYVAQALISSWISRYGIPTTTITDCVGQFESYLFKERSRILGIKRIRTTSYIYSF